MRANHGRIVFHFIFLGIIHLAVFSPDPNFPDPITDPILPTDPSVPDPKTHRPKLVKGEYDVRDEVLISSKYEFLQTSLEFDQELFMNEPFICAGGERTCPPLDCIPCDWSLPDANTCDDERCCVPLHPNITTEAREGWCSHSSSDSPPPFTRLEINKRSEVFTMDPTTTRTFRFFIGEEHYCYPVIVAFRSIYGNYFTFLSSTLSDAASWANFQEIGANWRENLWSTGQSVYNICPGWFGYTPGTYTLTVNSYEATSFYIEIYTSPESLPLLPVEGRARCSEVPEEEFAIARGDDQENPRKVRCLEDGETYLLTEEIGSSDYLTTGLRVILPVREGCHTVSLASQNLNGTSFHHADYDLSCLPIEEPLELSENQALGLWNSGDETISFTGCFPQTTFVHCHVESWRSGNVSIYCSFFPGNQRSYLPSRRNKRMCRFLLLVPWLASCRHPRPTCLLASVQL
jgi:hypothetical protein